jgi:hypothetical protein
VVAKRAENQRDLLAGPSEFTVIGAENGLLKLGREVHWFTS